MQDNFLNLLHDRTYFFDQGLRFSCQQCGQCCTGEHGTIYVSSTEILQISSFLRLSESTLKQKYLYPYQDSYSIAEDKHGNCLFYANGCRIYAVRPTQCRTFPFWFSILRSKKSWKQAQRDCPGLGRGTYFSKQNILSILEENMP